MFKDFIFKGSRFKVQGSLLFVTYTIIQGIIGSEMLEMLNVRNVRNVRNVKAVIWCNFKFVFLFGVLQAVCS